MERKIFFLIAVLRTLHSSFSIHSPNNIDNNNSFDLIESLQKDVMLLRSVRFCLSGHAVKMEWRKCNSIIIIIFKALLKHYPLPIRSNCFNQGAPGAPWFQPIPILCSFSHLTILSFFFFSPEKHTKKSRQNLVVKKLV